MAMGLLNRANRFLVSRQFAIWSLIILAVLLIVAGTLPDLSLLSEKELAQAQQSKPFLAWISSHFQVQQLTRSPFFLILPAAIWLSILLCSVRRVRSRLQWRQNEPGVGLLEQKGAHRFLGSVTFHFSMLVFLLGIIVSGLYRFDGEMILTEGQTIQFASDQFLRVNRNGIFSPRFSGTLLTLKRFESKFQQEKYPVDFAAYLNFPEKDAPDRDGVVKVNKPLKIDKWQLFLHRYGYAPRFQISDGSGRVLFDSYVNLVLSEPGQTDYFEVYPRDLKVECSFVSMPDRTTGSRQRSASDIALVQVRVSKSGIALAEHEIPLGQKDHFGEYDVTFSDLRNWVWFGIAYDPGYPFMIVGFLLCIAGLAFRFFSPTEWAQVHSYEKGAPPVAALAGDR
jgi:cytochrome c biogenesis protein ResB